MHRHTRSLAHTHTHTITHKHTHTHAHVCHKNDPVHQFNGLRVRDTKLAWLGPALPSTTWEYICTPVTYCEMVYTTASQKAHSWSGTQLHLHQSIQGMYSSSCQAMIRGLQYQGSNELLSSITLQNEGVSIPANYWDTHKSTWHHMYSMYCDVELGTALQL